MNVSQQNVMPCTDISIFIFHTNDFQNCNFSTKNELITFFLIHLLWFSNKMELVTPSTQFK